MAAIEGLVLSVTLPLIEERQHGERVTYDDVGTLRLQLRPGPSNRAQLMRFLRHELPWHMRGREETRRKARFESLFIDLSIASIRVCFVRGERDISFPQGPDDARYAHLQPLPALPGQIVYLSKDCPGCKMAWVDLVPPKDVDTSLCRSCVEVGEREKREATQMSQNRVDFSSGRRAVDQRGRSEVLRAWERYSLASLERVIQLALHRYHMRCPYPAHDTERVVEWCQSDPLHRFDYEDFIKEVTTILSGE